MTDLRRPWGGPLQLRGYVSRGGGHTRVRIFAGRVDLTGANAGELTFRNEEWDGGVRDLLARSVQLHHWHEEGRS